jgi:predicted DNA-binding transcriptional regulator AlpA
MKNISKRTAARRKPASETFQDDGLQHGYAGHRPIFLTPKEAAAVRRQGLSSFWRQVREGKVPKPYRVSPRCPRWLLTDILPQQE